MRYMLDRHTDLVETAHGQYRCEASDAYWNFDNAFGGWLCALAVEAVARDSRSAGHVISLSATFARPIGEGEIAIAAELQRDGNSAQFWRIGIMPAGHPEKPAFYCDMVLGKSSEGAAKFAANAPDAVGPGEVASLKGPPGPRWLEHFEQRPVSGVPFGDNTSPDSLVWIRETDQRPLDTKGLVAICDTLVPRLFFFSDRPAPIATVSLQIALNDPAVNLPRVSGEFVLVEGTGDFISAHTYHQAARIFAEDGSMLASSSQLALF